MPKPKSKDPAYKHAAEILAEIKGISEQRAASYGGITTEAIIGARYISNYLTARYGIELELDPVDYPILLALVKLARMSGGDRNHRDSYLDLANYLMLAWGVNKTLHDVPSTVQAGAKTPNCYIEEDGELVLAHVEMQTSWPVHSDEEPPSSSE